MVDPQLLLSCTQLTALALKDVKLRSSDPNVDEEDTARDLLEVLKNFHQLQHLNLTETLQNALYEPEPYAGLTASSYLTSLDISFCWVDDYAVNTMFAAERPCSGLLEASHASHLFECPGGYELLVSRCPALRCLEVVFPWDDHMGNTDVQGISALQSLTNLTQLYFCGVQLSDDALASIAQCQQLIDLSFAVGGVTLDGLQHLAQLTALTKLYFMPRFMEQPEFFDLKNKAPAGFPPDAHQQLRSHIDKQKKMQQAAEAASSRGSSNNRLIN